MIMDFFHTTAGRTTLRTGRLLRLTVLLLIALGAGSGCRQKMADQPSFRPYEPTDLFPDGRSERPLERGVIHRAQYIESDPLVTGLTREEWGRIYSREANPKFEANTPAKAVNREETYGAPRFDPPGYKAQQYGGEAHGGPAIYVDDFPFKITKDDMKRGEQRFTIYCAACHGPLGNGQGKIWERGYLTPTSFHTIPVGKNEVQVNNPPDIPLGFSRGYAIWGIKIPMREVPVGYIFEVITKGYGGMPNYAAQIPPADRWRIIAYVRALQLSFHAPEAKEAGASTNAGGKK
jgi:mono/diheme cytochrome c family protein